MEVGGKRQGLAALPLGKNPSTRKNPSTPCKEGRVGLLMSRYTDNVIPTALISRLIYHIYFVWLNSRTNNQFITLLKKADNTRQANVL
jgi:hypothetical protein